MDTVNHLLEGASPYQVLQNQAAKLSSKWDRSGLLEGIESSTEKNNMAILLENQAKQLVNEASTQSTTTSITNGSNSEAWAGVALPLVRRVFGEIVAKDLVSVQPMNLPAGLIFYLDFQYAEQSLDKAGSVKEAKLIYETIKDTFNVAKSTKTNSKKRSIREGLGMASKAAGTSTAPKREVISESTDMVARFKKLANIKINE